MNALAKVHHGHERAEGAVVGRVAETRRIRLESRQHAGQSLRTKSHNHSSGPKFNSAVKEGSVTRTAQTARKPQA
jgi:hypothetical protein